MSGGIWPCSAIWRPICSTVLGPTSSTMVLNELRKAWCEYQRSARGSTMPFLARTRSATDWNAPITLTIDKTTLPETSVAGFD